MEPVKKVDQSGLKIHLLQKDQISRAYNMIEIIKRHRDLLMGTFKDNT